MNIFPDTLPDDPQTLEELIESHEETYEPVKPEARAKIIWHNPEQKQKTDYSIVYLHGFKSSLGEGSPVHKAIADRFGCNLYLSRLDDHGLKRDFNFESISSELLIKSAIDACRIGQKIGDRVIVMGTSTGGSLALWAAGSDQCPIPIEALILYSPLIHLYGMNSLLLENRIGRSLLKLFPGRDHLLEQEPLSPEHEAIWYPTLRLNGALVLGETVQKIMRKSTFRNVRCPVFAGYYYKNRAHHDRIVSTSAIKRMAKQLGTPSSQVTLKNFPEAGSHVICNGMVSGAVQEVTENTADFLSNTVGLPQIPNQSTKAS